MEGVLPKYPPPLHYPNVGPFYSNVAPFYSEIGPFCSIVEPFCSALEPFCSNVEPFFSTLEPFWLIAEPFYSKLQPFCSKVGPIYSKLEPFWLIGGPSYSKHKKAEPGGSAEDGEIKALFTCFLRWSRPVTIASLSLKPLAQVFEDRFGVGCVDFGRLLDRIVIAQRSDIGF